MFSGYNPYYNLSSHSRVVINATGISICEAKSDSDMDTEVKMCLKQQGTVVYGWEIEGASYSVLNV
jgi:hypothetical protein